MPKLDQGDVGSTSRACADDRADLSCGRSACRRELSVAWRSTFAAAQIRWPAFAAVAATARHPSRGLPKPKLSLRPKLAHCERRMVDQTGIEPVTS